MLFLLASDYLKKTIQGYENYITQSGIDDTVIDAYIEASRTAYLNEKDIEYGLVLSKRAKELIEHYVFNLAKMTIWDLDYYQFKNETTPYSIRDKYFSLLLLESHYLFESFMLYMEKNRSPWERFYLPRRNPLKQVADLIQDLYDDKLDEGMVFCPGRIGKTQIVKMGNLWFGSNRPERSNLYSAYSDKITGGFYDGTLEMITDPTYTYAEIYPDNTTKGLTDGKDLTIDINRKKTYPTFTMRSIYGTLNGACDCDGLGIYDDLFSGIDEALSEDRQNTVWTKFDNNYMPRIKPGKAKLMGIGTRWAPRDVQGRRLALLENDTEYATVRHREIIIPALNEDGESNFDYPYKLGYTTQDYKRRMASFESNDDMASWFAQYQQEPIERKGQMFNVDTMNFFKPEEIEGIKPDRIFAANDPAYGGGDFVSMPICYEISGEYYVPDVVYNDGDKDITIPEVTSRIEHHLDKFPRKTAEVHFEETKTTSGYRLECEDIWKKDGYPILTSHDPADNQTAKMDRIKNHAPDIRRLHFVDMKYQTKEYRKYFQNILSCTYEGKMKHDDGVDSTAQLCDMIYSHKRKASIISSPI
nr:MAG TPA: Terminase [Bacteriophage sp.]